MTLQLLSVKINKRNIVDFVKPEKTTSFQNSIPDPKKYKI